MLPLEFYGQNVNFAISLGAALVLFAVFWLYFDAWAERHEAKEVWKWLGFLVISVSYVVGSTLLEPGALGTSIFGEGSAMVALGLRLAGLLLVFIGELLNPLQAVPHNEGLQLGNKPQTPAALAASSLPLASLMWAVPVAGLAVAGMYWRRATKGLERHLKPMAVALTIFALADLTHVAVLWRATDDPVMYGLVAPFGPAWLLEHAFLLAGAVLAGYWVWQYLTKRLFSQLFMVLTTMVLGIFLVTTMSFTALLLQNVQSESLNALESAGNVLQYAIDSKKSETTAQAEVVAQNASVIAAVAAGNHDGLAAATTGLLEAKKLTDLVIVGNSGEVLVRAADPEHWGDSLSNDPLVRRALLGAEASSVVSQQGVLTKQIAIRSATPIRSNAQVVGVAMTSVLADDAFVDGIKARTGLDAAIYSDNVRSATTFLGPDGTSRLVGLKEKNPAVAVLTLKQGKTFKGVEAISDQKLLAVYSPLKDVDNSVVGMLFVGRPQVAILQAAARSVELTFLVAALLLLISVLPVFYLSRYISRQLN